jgi:hypothetical protein
MSSSATVGRSALTSTSPPRSIACKSWSKAMLKRGECGQTAARERGHLHLRRGCRRHLRGIDRARGERAQGAARLRQWHARLRYHRSRRQPACLRHGIRCAGFLNCARAFPGAAADMRAKPNFMSRINVIWVVQSFLKKDSAFPKQKSILYLAPSRPTEGRWPSSLTRGGMRWTQKMLLTRAFTTDGKIVWS